MLGSFTAGILWDKFGASVPFLVSAIISLIIAFFIFLQKENSTDK
jgi:predicted MFS family arabinose efflux permease